MDPVQSLKSFPLELLGIAYNLNLSKETKHIKEIESLSRRLKAVSNTIAIRYSAQKNEIESLKSELQKIKQEKNKLATKMSMIQTENGKLLFANNALKRKVEKPDNEISQMQTEVETAMSQNLFTLQCEDIFEDDFPSDAEKQNDAGNENEDVLDPKTRETKRAAEGDENQEKKKTKTEEN
ncbi:uncharacterized protein LOC123543100 [Mercenaria mercenaria]|uniref:uncharacterized protein LOC123543100 n=1 Tax=Mercenaria mercenaria TaxID=6596 RepID=UPI00234E7A75|nr:uncharacterized protein LOC123543100 [Mercenaria mercenaria]